MFGGELWNDEKKSDGEKAPDIWRVIDKINGTHIYLTIVAVVIYTV
jgi:hypothetical protein